MGSRVVLLGHTLDDQAETVLLGLARGSGGRSIAGMRPRSTSSAARCSTSPGQQTEAACPAEGIEAWDDPHNLDPRFTRCRCGTACCRCWRRSSGPGVAAALARTADSLQADLEALDDAAAGASPPRPPRTGCGRRARAAPRPSAPGCCGWPRSPRAPGVELFHVHVLAMDDLLSRIGNRSGSTSRATSAAGPPTVRAP